MITVEDLLMAYASAYDAWLDPEAERKNPTPEYAELIRQAVSFENAKLREENERLRSVVSDGVDNARELRAENAKLGEQVGDACMQLGGAWVRCTELRELVRDANKAAHMLCEAWEGSCSKEAEGMSLHAVCPIGDTSELCVFGKLHDRMRELGVDDG